MRGLDPIESFIFSFRGLFFFVVRYWLPFSLGYLLFFVFIALTIALDLVQRKIVNFVQTKTKRIYKKRLRSKAGLRK